MQKINYCNKCRSVCNEENSFRMKVYHTHSNDPDDVSLPRNDKGSVISAPGGISVYICSACGESIFNHTIIEKNIEYNFCVLCLCLTTCPYCCSEITRVHKDQLLVEDIYCKLRCMHCYKAFYPFSMGY